jgi:undecaprenyl-diphosphatase
VFIFQAIILGIVEGLTEFLPISSTGHLVVAEQFLGFKDAAEIFTVVIQIGAIAAVTWYYREDLQKRVKGFLSGEVKQQRFLLNLIIATIPAGVVGIAVDKAMKSWAVPVTVAYALIIGGIILWLVEQYHRGPRKRNEVTMDEITPKQAFIIGCAQVVSLIPGVSRSGATIIGGMLSGLNRMTATAFSFYLAIPVMVLATLFKLTKHASEIKLIEGGALTLLIGTIVTFFVALAAVKWLLKYVSSHSFKDFAYYRIGFGIFILFSVWLGLLMNH